MSWSKKDAEAFVNGTKTFDEIEGTSQPDNTSTESNAEPSVTETASVEPRNDEPTEPEVEDKTASSETKDEPEKPVETKNKPRYTQEQKQQHAFAKEKAKRKQMQTRIAELEEKLKKYEGMTKDDFKGDEDAYIDYKTDRKVDAAELNRLKDEEQAARMEEAIQAAEQKEIDCFPDEAERSKYKQLITKAETSFATMHPELGFNKFSDLLLAEHDQSIIQYLQDSPNAPKLIKHFIYKPEAALSIMGKQNQYLKMIELRQLENRLLQHERIISSKSKPVVKKELPNTGKVVTNQTSVSNDDIWNHPWSKKDAERYMRDHQ